MDQVLQTVREMLRNNEDAYGRVQEHPGFAALTPIPFEVMAPCQCLLIIRGEANLREMLDKLQNYLGWDMRRRSCIDAHTAANIYDNCDQTSVDSVVEAICKMTEEQLNVIGV